MSDDEMRNVPYIVGRCTGEGDALLTGTIPIFLKAGLLEGFSREVFEMVLTGCFVSMASHCLGCPRSKIRFFRNRIHNTDNCISLEPPLEDDFEK